MNKCTWFGILALSLWLSGCACFGANARQNAECVVVRAAIDCAKPELLEQMLKAKPAIAHIMATRPDADQLLDGLKGMGLDVLACTVEQVVKDLMSRAASSPDSAAAMVGPKAMQVAKVWKARNLPAGTRLVNLQ